MKVSFVIVSVSDRVDQLNNLIQTIINDRRMDQYEACLLFQDPQRVANKIKNVNRLSRVFVVPEKMGCHAARVELLRRIRYDAYINLDDDIELTPYTNYPPAIEKAMEETTGFVLTNWAKTPSLLAAKVPKMKEAFVPQALVYQGGGMCYRDEIADLMRSLPLIKQTFDTAWPLTAYINGFTNYRYQGSLAVHRICGTGGMSAFMSSNPPQTMMEEYVKYRLAKRRSGTGKDLLIPLDCDLTLLARETHKAARIKRFSR